MLENSVPWCASLCSPANERDNSLAMLLAELPYSIGHIATVHGQRCPVDEGRLGAAEEQDRIGDFLRCAHSCHWGDGDDRVVGRYVFCHGGPVTFDDFSLEPPVSWFRRALLTR
jgi:hypothetical protein